MRKAICFSALVLIGLSGSAQAQPAAPAAAPAVAAIKAARMFDGRSDQTVANGVVIVEGSKIRKAVRACRSRPAPR